MLVDDDESLRVVGRLSLETVGGFDVVVARSGREALSLVETELPDLILLDMMMPDLDGLGTLAALRAAGRTQIPVIFLTAKVQAHEVRRYQDAGALAVIQKPFDPMTLPDTIRAIVARETSA